MNKTSRFFYLIVGLVIFSFSFFIGRTLGARVENSVPVEVVRQVLPPKVVNEYSFQRLNANMMGEVIALGDGYITIRTASNTVFDAYNEPQGITFVFDAQENSMTFEDIAIGDKISGGISVVSNEDFTVGGTGDRKLGDILLHIVHITK